MKRTRPLAWLLLLLLLLTPSLRAPRAAGRAAFAKAVYAFAYGSEAVVYATLTSEAEETWTLQTAEGEVLCSETMRGTGRSIPFRFTVPETLPRRTTLRLTAAGESLCQAELFCDQHQNGGVRRVAVRGKRMAITFDSAISAGYTPEILDVLDKFGVKATFFVIGRYVERNPELAAEIVARGHELASHSYEHLEMATASEEKALASILRAETVIRPVSGGERVLYRPPSGISSFRDRAMARGLGSEVILWSVDSGDGFRTRPMAEILDQIHRGLHNGGIMLMHVYGGYTVRLLETILPEYQAQGYEFVTVPELLLPPETSYIDAFGSQRPLHHEGEALDGETLALLKTEAVRPRVQASEPLKGSKNQTLSEVSVPRGLWRARVTNQNGWAFVIWSYDGRGTGELLVSGYSAYAGAVPLLGQGPYTFEVETNGNWTIAIEPLNETEAVAFAGRGDDVTDLFQPRSGTYRLSHKGESDFVVWLYTAAGETLLTHRLGPCEETVTLEAPPDSLAFFVVRADGAWALEPME